jgi:endonuclease-8
MPEGPSIIILKEAVQAFSGWKIKTASGNSKKVDFADLVGKKILTFRSWGKHFLICLPEYAIRIHFGMFGSWRINEWKEQSSPRLSLEFSKNNVLNFYACAISVIEKPLDEIYDWSADVMNEQWDAKKALQKLKAHPDILVCDALLDQQLFAGVGNIIKNEVLFRIRVHPNSKIGKLSPVKKRDLVKEAVRYSFQFLEWKKEFTLKKHWLAYTKTICPRDKAKIHKEYLGKTNRRTFYCEICQKLYI